MKLIRGRAEGASFEQMEATFTGTVWADPLLPATDGVLMNVVYFTPSARTHWHAHERGQVLHVTSGEGWIGVRGEAPERMRAGDTVWAPPGEEHWHGATGEAFLVHVALSLGQITWLEPVSDGEMGAAGNPEA